MAKRYDNPEAFKQALMARLRSAATSRGLSLQDMQIKFLIERLLARLFADPNAPWLLKGGFAMELRYRPKARTTRDVDLTATTCSSLIEMRERLQAAAELDLGDHLEFRIGSFRRELPGAPEGGARFPVEALLAGKIFGRFHIDIGMGDHVGGTPDVLIGEDLLGFAGVEPARALAIPKAQQFAEKLHAYTYAWDDRENTRVKDLVDLVLFIERGELEPDDVAVAIRETFTRRNTHEIPSALKVPPTFWATEFPALAGQAGLSTPELNAAFTVVAEYFNRLNL
jgi:Nucleotidyl transferase AbiEii toxin, Type IV TA system